MQLPDAYSISHPVRPGRPPDPAHVLPNICPAGFNRTGFVLCCYLIEVCGLNVDDALQSFAEARPPGVKHEAFRNELQRRYGRVSMGGLHATLGSPDDNSSFGCSPNCRGINSSFGDLQAAAAEYQPRITPTSRLSGASSACGSGGAWSGVLPQPALVLPAARRPGGTTSRDGAPGPVGLAQQPSTAEEGSSSTFQRQASGVENESLGFSERVAMQSPQTKVERPNQHSGGGGVRSCIAVGIVQPGGIPAKFRWGERGQPVWL